MYTVMWRQVARRAAGVACLQMSVMILRERDEREQRAMCLERRLMDSYHLLEPERPLGVGG